MPRIRVAFGVVVAVTLCIGFNMAHYPIVWQMVNARPNVHAATSSMLAAVSLSSTSAQKMPASPAKSAAAPVAASGNNVKSAGADEKKPAAKKESAAEKAESKPKKLTADDADKKKGGQDAQAKPSSVARDLTSQKAAEKKNEKLAPNEIRPPMVPIVKSLVDGEKTKKATDAVFAGISTAQESAGQDRSTGRQSRFERLPPLSFAESAFRGPSPSSSGGAIPFYPTTGR